MRRAKAPTSPDGSLPATLLHYLGSSPFIRQFARPQYFPLDEREDVFVPFEVVDSARGLFIQAGVDARTGQVNGAAISRVWT